MTLSTRQIQQAMTALRTTAEQDPSDVIANRASDLAWRLEAAGTNVFAMSVVCFEKQEDCWSKFYVMLS